MSELRDRIAAAVSEALDQWLQARGNTTTRFDVNYIVADAVIRELGLKKTLETGEIVDRDGGISIQYGRSRYITDWKADDDS